MITRFVCLFALFAASAFAQVRTFVSTQGVDNVNCSRPDPCRTFLAAVTAVQAGGEVVVLDSGGYGPVTITKAVSIIAPAGVYAAVAHTTGAAFSIEAGNTNVLLRNLHVTALGGTHGIHATTFASLHIESCSVSNVILGINMEASADGRRAFISDSNVRDASDSGHGIRALSSVGRLSVVISRTRSNRNQNAGFTSYYGSDMVCVDCEASGNGIGFWAVGFVSNGTLSCERCLSSFNEAAGFAADEGTLRLARSTAYQNSVGVRVGMGGAVIVLPGSNMLSGNSFDKNGAVILSTPDNP